MKLPAVFTVDLGALAVTLNGTVDLTLPITTDTPAGTPVVTDPTSTSNPSDPSNPTGTTSPVTGTGSTDNPDTPASALKPLVLPARLMTDAYPLNQPATDLPLETRSLNSGPTYTPVPIADSFLSTFGPNWLHIDNSMPFNVVSSVQTPKIVVPVAITTNWGSDDEGVGLPVFGCTVEGNVADPTQDRHLLAFDVDTAIEHELFGTSISADGAYSAQAYRRWDTAKPQVGAAGQNSADAAGLPILPLLLRYAEAAAGPILHALRMTINLSRDNANGGAFCPPASHASGGNWGSTAYMGQRLRLRADFPVPASGILRNIVVCLQTYGIVIADNGMSGLLTADTDPRWSDVYGGFNALLLRLQDFEVLNSGPIIDATGQPVV